MATATEVNPREIGLESAIWRDSNGGKVGVRVFEVDSADAVEVFDAMEAVVSYGDGYNGGDHADLLNRGWQPVDRHGTLTICRADYSEVGTSNGPAETDSSAAAGDAYHEIIESVGQRTIYGADDEFDAFFSIQPTQVIDPGEELLVWAYRANLTHRAHWASIRGKVNSGTVVIPAMHNVSGSGFTAGVGELLALSKRETVVKENLIRVDYRFAYALGGDHKLRYSEFDEDGNETVITAVPYGETAFNATTLWG